MICSSDDFTNVAVQLLEWRDTRGVNGVVTYVTYAKRTLMKRAHCALLAGLLLSPAIAHAESLKNADGCPLIGLPEDKTPEARKEHMRRGIEASRRSDWNIAYSEFRSAWCSEPHFAIAASLADVEMKLGHFDDAARHWLYFLKHAPVERTEERRDAHEQLAECRRHLGRVTVAVNDAAAQVFVDDTSVEWNKDEELWLEPGQHTFKVRSGDRESPVKAVAVIAGQTQAVEFTIAQPASREPVSTTPAPSSAPPHAPAAAPAPDHQRTESSGARTAVLITGGALTAIAVGAGVVFTLNASASREDVENFRDQLALGACAPSAEPAPLCDDLKNAIDDYNASSNWATGSFIAAGVLGAGTVATYFLWPVHKNKEARGASFSAAPLITGSHRGVQLRLAF